MKDVLCFAKVFPLAAAKGKKNGVGVFLKVSPVSWCLQWAEISETFELRSIWI